ncbi:MAG: hypothetical protein IJV45_01645 [Prevotella sp.]|nr:hypothetical protein [Prevotella sp.]
MKKYLMALLAVLSLAACSVDDGEMINGTFQQDSYSGEVYRNAAMEFDGLQLLLWEPPLDDWARLAGLKADRWDVTSRAVRFGVTEVGRSGNSRIYHVASESLRGDEAYTFVVHTADGDLQLWPEFGDNSELVVDNYAHTLTLALAVKAIHVVDGPTTTLGPDGRVFIFVGSQTE